MAGSPSDIRANLSSTEAGTTVVTELGKYRKIAVQ